MVLNASSGSSDQQPSSPTPGGANQSQSQGGGFNDPPFYGFFGRGRGGWAAALRGGGGGGFGQGFFRSETVSLEGGEPGFGPRGHHHGPPPLPGHHHPFWAAPPPPPHHPDPPLAPIPPVAPEPPSFGYGVDGQGIAGLFGHHARNFAGDLAAHFGVPPGDGSMPGGPGFGPWGGRGFGGWRGRGGFGGRGMRGGWRGRWPHHPEFVLPRMDIYQKGNTYTVTVNLPGLQKQNVDISVTEGLLTISGEFPGSNPPPEDDPFAEYDIMDDAGEEVAMEGTGGASGTWDDGNGHYIRHERPSGKFKRSVRLPNWVDLNSIQATMADGVLTLVIEKPTSEGLSSTRKLKIT